MARGYRYSGGGGGLPSSSNLKAIQKILDNHQEQTYLSVGQEVDITVNGQPWTMIIAAIDLYRTHDLILVSKELFSQSGWDDTLTLDASFYPNIDIADRIYIKETTKQYKNDSATTVTTVDAYTWVPNAKEAADVDTTAVYTVPLKQFDLFKIQANRIKQYAGANSKWWLLDYGSSASYGYLINESGTDATANVTNLYGLLPCFHMVTNNYEELDVIEAGNVDPDYTDLSNTTTESITTATAEYIADRGLHITTNVSQEKYGAYHVVAITQPIDVTNYSYMDVSVSTSVTGGSRCTVNIGVATGVTGTGFLKVKEYYGENNISDKFRLDLTDITGIVYIKYTGTRYGYTQYVDISEIKFVE